MKTTKAFFLGPMAIAAACFYALAPVSAEEWTRHYPAVPVDDLRAVASGEGAFVSVGAEGNILYSTDAEEWSLVREGAGLLLHSVAFAAGQWIAVGEEGVLASANGTDWAVVHQESGLELYWADRTGSRWVAVGQRTAPEQAGVVLESSDGISWTEEAAFPGLLFHSVAFAPDGSGLATGWDIAAETGIGLHFEVGGTWTGNPDAPELDLRAIRWDGERFVAAGELGMVAFTDDGEEWETVSTRASEHFPDAVFTDAMYSDIVRGPGFYVAVGKRTFGGSSRDLRAFSVDGETWSTQSLHDFLPQTFGLAATGDGVLAAGQWNSVHRIDASGQWELLAGETTQVNGVAYGNGIYVAVAGPTPSPFAAAPNMDGAGSPKVLTSEDLESWTAVEKTGPGMFRDVVFFDGWFVAVGEQGAIARSMDGTIWEPVESPVANLLLRVIHAGGKFIAVGKQVILTSDDGLEWDEVPLGYEISDVILVDIVEGDGRFVAVGRDSWEFQMPTLLVSEDLNSWERVSIPDHNSDWSNRELWSVAHGPRGFYATGHHFQGVPERASLVVYSEDLIDWNVRESIGIGPVSAIGWFEGRFIASSYVPTTRTILGEEYWEFYDAETIEPLDAPEPPPYLWRFREVNGRLFGIGDGETIGSLRSAEVPYFLHQPVDAVVEPGEAAMFSFEAENPHESEMTMQWLFEGELLEDDERVTGSDSTQLSIADVVAGDSGQYSVRLVNAAGETVSSTVQLHVRRAVEVSADFDLSTPGWGVDRFASIQAAINSVGLDEYASVIVKPGVYLENIVFSGRSVLVTGEDADDWDVIEATVIDGDGDGSVVRIIDGEDEHAILRGLTIRNGRARQGGGVFIENAYPRIMRNRIVNNLAEADEESSGGGGGLAFHNAWDRVGAFFLTDNVIAGNTVTRFEDWGGFGGGVEIRSQGRVDLFVQRNRIEENVASSSGGIRINISGSLSQVEIRENLIANNLGTSGGGGLNVVFSRPGELKIESNSILNNEGYVGGGLSINALITGWSETGIGLILRDTRIADNVAFVAAGLRLSGAINGRLEGLIVADNEAAERGGGLFVSGGGSVDASMVVESSTIVGNSAPMEGAVGGSYSHLFFRNSIVALNTDSPVLIPGLTSEYNNIWGNFGNTSGLDESPAGENGNISLDPLFADPGGGDYRLRSSAGRWDPAANGGDGGWVIDAEHSPSIAAGAPDGDGSRRNQGGYGLTAEASLPLDEPLVSAASRSPGFLDKATAQEGATVLSRSGSLESGLAVDVTLGGTAEEGVDFEMTGEPVFFEPGETVTLVNFVPLSAGTVRGDREIIFALEAAPSYSRGVSRDGKIQVYDLPYNSWIAGQFAPENWDDPVLTDPLADGDGSGMPNLTRFAFAVENGGDQDRLPTAGVGSFENENEEDADYLTIRFIRPVRHDGWEYSVERSGDLSGWDPVEASLVEVEPLEDGETERVTLRDEIPLTDRGEFEFLRVRLDSEE